MVSHNGVYSGKSVEDRAGESQRAFELRLQGYRPDQIADILNVSVSTVNSRIKRGLHDHVTPVAEEYRKVEDARLDHLYVTMRAQLDSPYLEPKDRVAASNALVRIAKRRAELLGLDMPAQFEIKHEFAGSVDDEIAMLTEQLTASDSDHVESQ